MGLVATVVFSLRQQLEAQVRTGLWMGGDTLAGGDNCSSGPINIGFSVNFFGASYTQLYITNNDYVTFGGPLATGSPFPLSGQHGTPDPRPVFCGRRYLGAARPRAGTG